METLLIAVPLWLAIFVVAIKLPRFMAFFDDMLPPMTEGSFFGYLLFGVWFSCVVAIVALLFGPFW